MNRRFECIFLFQTFVHNNNLYYQEDPLTTYTSVTNSGQPGLIFNGIPDWLYEGGLNQGILKKTALTFHL